MGVDVTEALARRRIRGHRTDLDRRVGEQQAKDLAAGIPASTYYCCRCHDA